MQAKDVEIQDALIRHQLDLLKLSNGTVKEVLAQFKQLEIEIVGMMNISSTRLTQLLADIDQATAYYYDRIEGISVTAAASVAAPTAEVAALSIAEVIGTSVLPSNAVLEALASDTMIQGAPQSAWWSKQSTDSIFRFQNAIRRGMSAGVANNHIIRSVRDEIKVSQRHAETLTRTSILTVSNEALMASYQANSDMLAGVEWVATLDSRTCLQCAPRDGLTWTLDGKAIGHRVSFRTPPRHFSCVHPETSVFAPDKVAAFITTYNGPVVEITLSHDRRFTVSANHMLATKDGLVRASSLTDRDYIVDTAVGDGFLFADPNDNRHPSSIKEQVESFSKTPGVSTHRMPTATEHLNGDAIFTDGYVDVITFDSLLRGDFKSFCNEFFGKDGFMMADIIRSKIPFYTSCDLTSFLWGASATLSCDIGSFAVSPILFRRALLHHLFIGNSVVSSANEVFVQNPFDHGSTDTKRFGQSVFGNKVDVWYNDVSGVNDIFAPCTTEVQPTVNSVSANVKGFSDFVNGSSRTSKFTSIKNIRTFNYSGHLYDLQCFSGLYTIQGVVSSNCRCLLSPVTKTYEELGIDLPELKPIDRSSVAGPVGGNMDFEAFLKRQGPKFQKEVLGAKRVELWRKGKITLLDLINGQGRVMTLDELQNRRR